MPRALSIHIGLNAVSPRHYEGWSGELVACENDAHDMAEIAKAAKMRPSLLLAKRATRTAVLGALRRAAGTLTSGDFLFVSYSGHGGQVPDLNNDEPDDLDETWCLFDGEVLDDELAAGWAAFKAGVRILVLSDSCHSGTVTRAMAYHALESTGALRAIAPREEDGPPRYRYMPPSVAMRTYRVHRALYDRLQKNAAKSMPVRASVLLISGCQDNQTSQDGAFNGAFTEALLRVWKHGAFQGDYRAFHRAIGRRLPPTQTPEYSLLGAPNPVFEAQRPFTV